MLRTLSTRPAARTALLACCIAALQPGLPKRQPLARRNGFFDVLSDAFANDETVSKLDYGDNAPAAPGLNTRLRAKVKSSLCLYLV